ncbi:MAG: segregation/condensation protein A [Methanoregula sp.]|nr:segregation/condensation protein A [Methanoregula sp.]
MADSGENEPGHNPLVISKTRDAVPESEERFQEDSKGIPQRSPDSSQTEPLDPALQGVIEDPVEILVRLAERGEIDPWNINIIEVTDRFLTELERCRQLNLQISGRTLFYAATLLRMKSEHLELLSDPDEKGIDEDDELFGEDYDIALDSEIDYQGRLGPIERLEHEIQRRLDRKNMRKSPVTLFELIIELKNIEKEERRRRRLTETGNDFLIYAEDVVGIAHDEDYQESAMTVLEECLDCIEYEEEMTLVQLCQKLGWAIPEVYIPLLFLMLEGRCTLRQEEFFSDVFVQICRAGN